MVPFSALAERKESASGSADQGGRLQARPGAPFLGHPGALCEAGRGNACSSASEGEHQMSDSPAYFPGGRYEGLFFTD